MPNVKPPICEICGDFFTPSQGALLRFAGTDRGAAFDERQRTEGIVGHQPDSGWFCGEHVERARELAADMTLAEAVSTIRGVPYVPPVAPEPEPAEPQVKDDDLGVGYRITDVDGSGAIEWPIDWLTASDLRTRCIETAPAIARALGGPGDFEWAETTDRRRATVEGSGPDDDPWVDTIRLRAHDDSTAGRAAVEVRHVQKHLRHDTIIDVQVDLSVRVTTAAGHRRRATLAAWGHISDDHCNRLRLTGVDTGQVVELVRIAFDLGTDRWDQRYADDGSPICMSCGEAFHQSTGGKAVFRVDAAGHDWNDRMRRGEESGDRPYHGWFCTRHIGPASLVSDSLTRMQAMPLLVPRGRPPLEYREHPEGIDVRSDEYGEPSRAPFLPVSLEFDPQWSTVVAIIPQAQREANLVLSNSVGAIGAALGVDHFRNFGSTDDTWSSQSNDMSAFLVRRMSRTLILQRREQTILEVSIRPTEPQTLAPDGEVVMDRVEVRAATADIAAAVQPEIDALIAQLNEEQVDPFDLSPDLVDVDLRNGDLRRASRGRPGFVHWNLEPVNATRLSEQLEALLASLVGLLGTAVVPELKFSTDRSYTPMDGAQPPHCPFTDRTRRRGSQETGAGTLSVEISTEHNHWTEDHVANALVSVRISLGDLVLSATFSGQGNTCTSMLMSRPVVPGSIAAIIDAFPAVSA